MDRKMTKEEIAAARIKLDELDPPKRGKSARLSVGFATAAYAHVWAAALTEGSVSAYLTVVAFVFAVIALFSVMDAVGA